MSQTSYSQDMKIWRLGKSLPQTVDMDADSRFHGIGGRSPELFQKLSSGKCLLWIGEQFI